MNIYFSTILREQGKNIFCRGSSRFKLDPIGVVWWDKEGKPTTKCLRFLQASQIAKPHPTIRTDSGPMRPNEEPTVLSLFSFCGLCSFCGLSGFYNYKNYLNHKNYFLII